VKGKRKYLISLSVIFFLLTNSAFAKYSGGTGDPNDPYQIADVNDLLTLAADVNDCNKCFILTADINLQGQNFTQAVIAPAGGPYFSGKFDGDGHIITHLKINGSGNFYLGLFGRINSVGEVKNLGIEDCNIVGGSSASIGGLAGYNEGSINNCCCSAIVAGFSSIGGLVGESIGGSISYCYSDCIVSGSAAIGGLVGYNNNAATINHCRSAGSVRGENNVGGLVGRNYSNSIIRNCYSAVDVNCLSGGYFVGGLVGSNEYSELVGNNITDCFSTGPVAGYRYVGGLVGQTRFAGIADCYSTSPVSGNMYLGGLAGYKESGSINKCYSAGPVRAASGAGAIGGLVGFNNGDVNIVSSFWDINTSGQATSAGGQAKTVVEMKTASTFTSAGWDFDEKWDIIENQTYPYFKTFLDGDINRDGKVDFYDFAIFASHWLQ
jgi:hypothetical protein